jgi:glycosyltransferase involved in cell wall biosynthesis
LSAARNEGLDAATGEFLGFVDSDDWIDLDMFKFLYELLETEEADISICSHYIEKSGRTKIKYSSDEVLNLVPCDAMRLLVEDDIIRNFAWDKLYRRTLFHELRFPQGRYFEDIAVMYKVFYQARKIVMKGCPKYHYMVRTNSITGSKYNPEKEYHMFLAVYEQCTFIQEKELWDKAPVFIIRSGVHLMDHIMLVPSSPFVEEIVRDVLNKMHQYDNFSFRQIGMAIAVKRWAIYHNLSRYRSVYRFVRSVFKSKSHRF